MAAIGLRERKKAATRALITDAADRLFLERGFEHVTLDEVAEACDVSVRTVLRYFATKEELALAEETATLERLRTGLSTRSGSVLDFWRENLRTTGTEIAARSDWFRRHYAMIGSPPLRAVALRIQREAQELLAAALEEEQEDGDRLMPNLLAAALIAGSEVVLGDWMMERCRLPDAFLEVADVVVERFGPH